MARVIAMFCGCYAVLGGGGVNDLGCLRHVTGILANEQGKGGVQTDRSVI